jgi:hypothetical protein
MENDGFLKFLVCKTAVGGLLYVMQSGTITETACSNLHPDIQEDLEPRKTIGHVQYAFMWTNTSAQ